jgi:hypothetical protein
LYVGCPADAGVSDLSYSDYVLKVSTGGTISIFATLLPESDPVALEFPPEGSDFGNSLYASANNRDGGRLCVWPGDYGGTMVRIDSIENFCDFTNLGIESNSCSRPSSSNSCHTSVLTGGLGEPVGFDFGPGGTFGIGLFVANSTDPPGDIATVDSGGNVAGFLEAGNSPGDVEFGPGDSFGSDLYFVNIFDRSIWIAASDHSVSLFVTLPSDSGAEIGRDIEFAAMGPFGGDLYAAVSGTSSAPGTGGIIYRVKADKSFSAFATGFSGLSYDAMEFSPDGTALFVADHTTKKIYKIYALPKELECDGFKPPVHDGAIKVKKNRCIPFKAQLVDASGYSMTDADIYAAPVIQVFFESAELGSEAIEVDALPAGVGTEGNQFEFIDGLWQFNLKTKNYSASGTYTVTMESGNEDEYTISSSCTAEFVIE